jgi:multidrug resistance efflux pump
MIFTAIITSASVVRPAKSYDTIKKQMERIYKLYAQGYGTREMLEDCEQKVYVIFTKIPY